MSNLWLTPYGRLLVVKTTLVADIVACGYISWRRLRALHQGGGLAILALEAILAGAVTIVTGFLTETGHP